MVDFLKSRGRAFGHAFSGLGYLVRTQQAVLVHIIANILVFGMAVWLELGKADWITLLLTVSILWVAEILNTAVEVVVDMFTEEIHPLAKAAKDLGAAAVMVTATCAIIIGVIVLGPPLWERLGF